jgi:hypothetical protein
MQMQIAAILPAIPARQLPAVQVTIVMVLVVSMEQIIRIIPVLAMQMARIVKWLPRPPVPVKPVSLVMICVSVAHKIRQACKSIA